MKAGIQINFYLGQHVKVNGLEGKIRALSIEGDDSVIAIVTLNKPYIVPACSEYGESRIYTQAAPVHDLVAL